MRPILIVFSSVYSSLSPTLFHSTGYAGALVLYTTLLEYVQFDIIKIGLALYTDTEV